MSARRFLHSLPLPALSLATTMGLGLPACSSDDSGTDAGAGTGQDGSTHGGEGGNADATPGADGSVAVDGGTPAVDASQRVDGAPLGTDGAVAGDDSGNDAGTQTDTGAQIDVGVPPVTLCPIETPLTTSIVDFTPRPNGATDGYSWGDFATSFSGYTLFYNTAYLVSDVTTGAWRISGMVEDYSGFGLGFVCMTDASAYAGIQFMIKGNAGTPSQLTFSVSTAADDVIDPYNPTSHARCTPAVNQYDGTCAEPRLIIDVPSDWTTYSIRWSDLLAGRPSPVNPAEITRLTWVFAWPATAADGSASGYPVDVTIDNVAFLSASSGDAGATDSAVDGSVDATLTGASTDGSSADAAADDDATDGGSASDAAPE
jgi:hypothetical protein